MTFVDLTKAFDTISRGKKAKFGYIVMVRQFHDCMLVRVQSDRQFSETFVVGTNRDVLWHQYWSAMLKDDFQDGHTGFPIRYRFDGKLFNLRRLQAKTKVQTDVLDDLLYADDMDKNASSEANMQRTVDQVS